MAAAEKRDDWWVERQRRREERMRYEVLRALYEASERRPCVSIGDDHFLGSLGVWREELDRVVAFLVRRGYLTLEPSSPEVLPPRGSGTMLACITQRGIDYIQHGARRRRSIRDEEE